MEISSRLRSLTTTASIHRVLDYVPGRPERDFFTIEVVATPDSLEIAGEQGWDVFRGLP